jgi:transposase
MEKQNKKASFKEYDYSQGELFPQNISDWIPKNHLVRVVDKVIESIDIAPIVETYKGGGCSSYHPKMMLKIIIYAYCEKIYSCRKIDKALKENINFIWISGHQTPDFRTINRFRLRLKKTIKKIFFKMIRYLIKNKYLSFENYFLDGTKLEANANKYTFVWKKATDKYKNLLLEKIEEMFENIEKINSDEDVKNKIKDSKNSKISSKELSELKKTIDESLKKEPDKELKKYQKR